MKKQLVAREQEITAVQARMQASYREHVKEVQQLQGKVGRAAGPGQWAGARPDPGGCWRIPGLQPLVWFWREGPFHLASSDPPAVRAFYVNSQEDRKQTEKSTVF